MFRRGTSFEGENQTDFIHIKCDIRMECHLITYFSNNVYNFWVFFFKKNLFIFYFFDRQIMDFCVAILRCIIK